MDSTYGPSCPQVDISAPCTPGGATNPIIPEVPEPTSEDCLFLDIYVPRSAWESQSMPNTPVVVWIYGGAYAFGSKNTAPTPFYNATGLIQTGSQSPFGGNFIFVTGNYRLGAFGWLAGSTMESKALPNAGLYDQKLVLEWVQNYIHLVGGNSSDVSAWGESAGASSILHHLISYNGKKDPLFKKAVTQSPAFQWQWDRNGTLESVFANFTTLANCTYTSNALTCLQKASTDTLALANQQLFAETFSCTGIMPMGHSLDGNLIQHLAPVALYNGTSSCHTSW